MALRHAVAPLMEAVGKLYGGRVPAMINFTAGATLTAAYRSQMASGTGRWGFYAASTANNAFLGNVAIGKLTAPSVALDVVGAGAFTTTLSTGAPSGSTAGLWKLGAANTVSPTSPNRTIAIDIGGTVYYLAAKTTND